MDASVISDSEQGPAADVGITSDESRAAGRRDQIGLWMIVAGTATLLCAVGESATNFLEWNGSGPLSWSTTSLFLRESPPLFVIAMSWPLLIGLLVRRPQGARYLRVASITFFALALGGALGIFQAISLRSGSPLLVGSFLVSPGSLLRGQPSAWARTLVGMAQLAFELMIAIQAAVEVRSLRGIGVTQASARDRVRGRVAFYLTLCFVLVCIRTPVWSAYVVLVNRSPFVRSYVIATGSRPRYGRGAYGLGRDPWSRWATMTKTNEAARLATSERIPDAKIAYLMIIAELERSRKPGDLESDAELARALNNLAWLLATSEYLHERQPADAVKYARRAVQLAEGEGNYWNTLGAAYVRSGQWEDARGAFARSMELRQGEGDAYDWYFLAILQAQQGNMSKAREWYEKAVEWTSASRPEDRELHRFQVEAAEKLGLPTLHPRGTAKPVEPGSAPAPTP